MQYVYENFMMRAEIKIRVAQREWKGGVRMKNEDNTESPTWRQQHM